MPKITATWSRVSSGIFIQGFAMAIILFGSVPLGIVLLIIGTLLTVR